MRIRAQPQTEISIGGDLVSTYVWRGVYQSGFSLQPEIGLSVGGFTVGVWGSTDLDNFKEVDLSVGYSVRGFSVGVTDYWWGGQRLGDGRFAPYFKYGDTHYFEGTLAYEFGEKFPLGISWSTMFGLVVLRGACLSVFCGFGRTDCCGWCSAMGGSGLVAGWIRRIPDIECVAQGFSGDPRIGKIRNSPFRPACGQPAAQLHEPCHRPLVLKTVAGMRTNIMGTMLTDRRPESSRRPEKAVRNF